MVVSRTVPHAGITAIHRHGPWGIQRTRALRQTEESSFKIKSKTQNMLDAGSEASTLLLIAWYVSKRLILVASLTRSIGRKVVFKLYQVALPPLSPFILDRLREIQWCAFGRPCVASHPNDNQIGPGFSPPVFSRYLLSASSNSEGTIMARSIATGNPRCRPRSMTAQIMSFDRGCIAPARE